MILKILKLPISQGVFRRKRLVLKFWNYPFPKGVFEKRHKIHHILKWTSIENPYSECGSQPWKTSENEESLRASQEKFPPAPRGGQTRAPKETLFSKWFRKKICETPKQYLLIYNATASRSRCVYCPSLFQLDTWYLSGLWPRFKKSENIYTPPKG